MHRDMIGPVALDFVLWIVRACVVDISFVINVSGMDFDDFTADAAGLRVPGHVIANLESLYRRMRLGGFAGASIRNASKFIFLIEVRHEAAC